MSGSTTTVMKVVYFDKETIGNILQQQHGGDYLSVESKSDGYRVGGEASAESSAAVKLQVPFSARLKFLVTGRVDASFVRESGSLVTVSSTDISQFEAIKPNLKRLEGVSLKEIKNSLTSFRMAAGLLNAVKDGVAGVKTRELMELLEDVEGYSVYEVASTEYVRFNTQAFLSNYRYNDILHSKLELYCIEAGVFERIEFDYLRQIQGIQDLFDIEGTSSAALADMYPPRGYQGQAGFSVLTDNDRTEEVTLYDVVCAYLAVG